MELPVIPNNAWVWMNIAPGQGSCTIPTSQKGETMSTISAFQVHDVTHITVEPQSITESQSYCFRRIIVHTTHGDIAIELFSKFIGRGSDEEPSMPVHI